MGRDKEKLLDRARDELFSHIHRCDVLEADPGDQEEWMEETIEYLGERYPDLSRDDLQDLRAMGMRFCRPAIPHGDAQEEVDGVRAENTEEEGDGANVA